jgi:hypothetical protein
MSSCSSDAGNDSLESFPSSDSEHTDNEHGTPPATDTDSSSDDSDEEPRRPYQRSGAFTELLRTLRADFWSCKTDNPFFVEEWASFGSQLLHLERLTAQWEARYSRTQDRLDPCVTYVVFTMTTMTVISPPPPLCTQNTFCTQNMFVCAPPAGQQHLLGYSYSSCCAFAHIRMLSRCFPFDRGKRGGQHSSACAAAQGAAAQGG